MTTATAPASPHPLVEKHGGVLEEAAAALAARSYYSRYPESPSPRVYGEGAAEAGVTAYEALLGKPFAALGDQPTDGSFVGSEVSPYGPALSITYPHLDVDPAVAAAHAAVPAWRDAGARVRAAVCVEIVDRINQRSFEMANAVMHTTGQPFVMAFQAAGPHAQDRALESIVAALVEQERVPESVVWEKPGKAKDGTPAPLRMQKDYRIVPRGLALVVGCNTFPTWNGYPGLFASLSTGNPVVVKPHPRAVAPLAISVAVCREVLAEAGFSPALVQLAAEADGEGLAKVLAERDEVKIVDYTGGPAFGAWLEQNGAARGQLVYAEKAGVNSIVVDSTDNLRGMLGNLAFSLSLYSGQMCTTPQNIYVPRSGVDTDEGHLSFEEFGQKLAGAVQRLTGDDAKAVEILGATVNDGVRASAGSLADVAAGSGGAVVLDSRKVSHPAYPEAVVRAPGPGLRRRLARGRLQPRVLRAGRLPHRHGVDRPVAGAVRRHDARARGHDRGGLLQLRGCARGSPRGRCRGGRGALGKPHRPSLREPDRRLLRLPRHRREPRGQRRVRRRCLRREPLPCRDLQTPRRLTASPCRSG